MIWLAIIFYLVIWAVGVYLVWKAYQLGIKKDLRHAKKLNGVPYRHPHRFMRTIALTDLLIGLAVILFAIAIPLLKIKFQTWGSFVGGAGLIRLSILMGLASKDET